MLLRWAQCKVLFGVSVTGINCPVCNNCAVASTEMTVQNLEEKAELNETIERLKAQFAAVSGNLEVQTADNAQLSRYRHAVFVCSVLCIQITLTNWAFYQKFWVQRIAIQSPVGCVHFTHKKSDIIMNQ